MNEKNAASAIYKTTVIIDFSAGKVKDGILTDFLKSALDRGGENMYDKLDMSNQ